MILYKKSPRSKKAILSLGIDEKKLYQLSKKDYLATHPELKSVSTELQDKRYEHYNQKRQELINEAKETRNELIKMEEEQKSKSQSKGNKSTSDEANGSTVIENERKKLEAMKKQQIGEIKNMIDYEIKLEETRRQGELRMKKQEEKEREMAERKKKEQKEKEERARQKEEEKKKKKQEEEAERERKNKEQEEKKKK